MSFVKQLDKIIRGQNKKTLEKKAVEVSSIPRIVSKAVGSGIGAGAAITHKTLKKLKPRGFTEGLKSGYSSSMRGKKPEPGSMLGKKVSEKHLNKQHEAFRAEKGRSPTMDEMSGMAEKAKAAGNIAASKIEERGKKIKASNSYFHRHPYQGMVAAGLGAKYVFGEKSQEQPAQVMYPQAG